MMKSYVFCVYPQHGVAKDVNPIWRKMRFGGLERERGRGQVLVRELGVINNRQNNNDNTG